ncbi:MAG: envelope stress response membrane protein PspC [Deltaproteobacteria bacterium]|nr:envelope stress response membrane protein PspC [Deltaproteobacteria bacterium]MBW1961809.1 envelope stress response membrane protein PspC [Deltaproteobacteria bacterium]MBW1994969.1 envelope stress response membrane protein PspC [Deltaproteobacteria bacterium]MBW2152253.1 envelope stress response membrane protein PspC [Deltaproteobacteria bacterium]
MKRFRHMEPDGLYRSRNGIIMGVCRGLAEYFNFSVFWVRVIFLGLLIFTGFWPVGVLYLVAALVMKPEPVIPIHTEAEREFYDSYTHSRYQAAKRLKRKYESLRRRIQRLEDIVTSPEFNWHDRFKG